MGDCEVTAERVENGTVLPTYDDLVGYVERRAAETGSYSWKRMSGEIPELDDSHARIMITTLLQIEEYTK